MQTIAAQQQLIIFFQRLRKYAHRPDLRSRI
jgi:hypothetical protein